ncbi:MAG: hypothetical protein WD061_02635 [Candidatus Saccharimonadales bacterium]
MAEKLDKQKKPNTKEAKDNGSTSGWKHFRLQKPNEATDKLNSFPVKIAILAVILIGLSALAWVAVGPFDSDDEVTSPEAFSIDNESFSEDDIAPYVAGAKEVGIDPDILMQAIEEGLIFKTVADEYDIEISDELIKETLTKYDNYDPDLIESNAWVRLVGFRLAMEDMMDENISDDIKGYSFVFHFGTLSDPFIPDAEEMGETLPEEVIDKIGDEEAIAADRAYAKERAEYYHEQLTAGSMSPEEAFDEIRNDNRLNPHYFDNPDLSYSRKFGFSDDYWKDEVALNEVINFIEQESSADQYSDIEVGEFTYVESDDHYDAYYYFVYLEEPPGVWNSIASKLNELGVTILW